MHLSSPYNAPDLTWQSWHMDLIIVCLGMLASSSCTLTLIWQDCKFKPVSLYQFLGLIFLEFQVEFEFPLHSGFRVQILMIFTLSPCSDTCYQVLIFSFSLISTYLVWFQLGSEGEIWLLHFTYCTSNYSKVLRSHCKSLRWVRLSCITFSLRSSRLALSGTCYTTSSHQMWM